MKTERKTLPAGADPDDGQRARADVYRLLAALLAGPADQALLELLRSLESEASAGTAMNSAWQALRTAEENAGAKDIEQE